MKIFKVKILGDTIIPLNLGYVIENQINEYAIEFDFDNTWDYEEKYVIFQDKYGDQTFKRAIINNQVIIPSELLNGRINIQVYAQNIEDNVIVKRRPSLKYSLSIIGSLPTNASEEQDVPTPTQWELYIQQIEDIAQETAENILTDYNETKEQVNTNKENISTNTNDISLLKLNTYKVYNIPESITQSNLQEVLDKVEEKILIFQKGITYTFDDTLHLNANTILELNGATIKFTCMRGFFNFKLDDTFLKYDGNGNITIRNGNIEGGNISFCHSRNVLIENIHYSNLLKDHFVEINSQSGMTIKNCVFDGDTDNTTNYKEYLQIDDMDRGNFPYFTNPNNPTYDLTSNENITIENNVFKLTDSTNFVFHTAIGSHTSFKDHPHKNIIIRNNYIDSPSTAGIRLRNVEGALIENNVITFSDINNRAKAIHLNNYNKDIIVKNNRIYHSYQFLICEYITASIEYFNDYIQVENNIVEDTGAYVNGREIIDMNDCLNSFVKNNTFTNINGILFYTNITPELYDSSKKYNCYFENNNCSYVENDNAYDVMCLYGGNWHINNNVFYVPSYSKNTLMRLGGAERSGVLYFTGNRFTALRLANIIDFNNYNKTLSNVYGIPFDQVLSSGSTSITDNMTYDFTQFNSIRIGLTGQNGSQNTQEYQFWGYNSKKLDSRKYLFATPDRNGENIIQTTFELKSNGQYSYFSPGGNTAMDLRYIILENK